MHRSVVAATLALALIGGGCGADEHTATGPVGTPGASPRWAAPNADLHNTRRVTSRLDSRSVGRLRVAWRIPLAAGYVATPVVVGRTLFTQDLQSNVYAIDVHSGRRLWTKRYEVADIGPNGVTAAHGTIYGTTSERVFALDARSGRERWSKRILRFAGDSITMAPGYKDGTVYVSTSVQSAPAAGTLWALDARTGHTRWRWQQVPSALWGHRELNSGGGLWHPPAFDDRGNLYAGIANPLPFPGTSDYPWGSSRPGPNRWNNSIVKLDARTGRLKWARQVLPHDIFDWDLECPVILAAANGRRIALAAGKMGIVYAFDADDGTPLWKRPVGIHNGHDDDNLLAMRGKYEQLRLPFKVYPGDWGGVETPMASDGKTVYVPVNDLYMLYHSQAAAEQQDLMQGTGELVALDIASGRVRWDRKLPHSDYGGATISNDVVFTTTYEGRLWALNARSGETLWSAQLPAGTDTPVGIAGDTLITAGSIPLDERQHAAIVAYRLR